jgi:hypothetical protein
MNKLTQTIKSIIQEYDTKGADNECQLSIDRIIENAISKNEPLNFVIFTCSTINFEYLWSDTPWLYVNTNPKGNNLEPDLPQITKVMSALKKAYPKTQLKILIGNTDPYYIYLQQFKDFPSQKRAELLRQFNARWETYRQNFERWAKTISPNFNPEVISWYQFERAIEQRTEKSFESEYEATKSTIASCFKQDQFDWELRKLQTQFGAGKYFEKLEKPNDDLLKDWIVRKFTEYAVQAKWIYENIPNAILIQNEKPSDLRSQMYQPLVRKKYKTDFPIAYFLGVDNAGYQ